MAERLQVSRATVSKWARRYRADGLAGLADRSSKPHRSPSQTARRMEQRIMAVERVEPGVRAKQSRCALAGDGDHTRSVTTCGLCQRSLKLSAPTEYFLTSINRLPQSTVSKVLNRYTMPLLGHVDLTTGRAVRKPNPLRDA